ncbi:MAG: hypothetical protein PHD25_03500 [Bacteroidales bacterium]|nr:hypothetical protein [Bacteroidales bacterium]
MVYTGLPAVNFILFREQPADIKQKGRTNAIFKLTDVDLKDYRKDDTATILINEQTRDGSDPSHE